jgi:hypothetical protein
MNKKIIQLIPSIILYVCAGLLAIYAIWSFTYCADIISQAKAAGQLAASGSEYDIASFYMNNCGQYAVFTLLLAAAGLVLQRKQPASSKAVSSVKALKNDANDKELDEWFSDEPANNVN